MIITRKNTKSNDYFDLECDGRSYDHLKINLPDGNNICIEFLEKNKFDIYSITSKDVKFIPTNLHNLEFQMEVEKEKTKL